MDLCGGRVGGYGASGPGDEVCRGKNSWVVNRGCLKGRKVYFGCLTCFFVYVHGMSIDIGAVIAGIGLLLLKGWIPPILSKRF